MRRTTISRATFCSLGRAGALTLALFGLACGKRGDPLPPLRPVPSAAETVTLSQIGGELVLEWKAPSRNQDGTAENLELREVRVLRRVLDFAALREAQSQTIVPPEPSPAPASEIEIPSQSEEPASAVRPPAPLVVPPFAGEALVVATLESLLPEESLVYRDAIDPLWIGKRLEYALVYANRRKLESPLSTIVQIEPVPELEAPGSLIAEAGDGFVSLKWVGPEEANETFGYAVFRRLAEDEKFPDSPLTEELVHANEFEDRTATFGTEQCWVVSRVLIAKPVEELETTETPSEEPVEPMEPVEPVAEEAPPPPLVPPIANPVRIESAPSPEACLIPNDSFAPEAPEDLVGVPSRGGILLTWRAVEASDLASYRVYRSTSAGGDFQLLGEVSRASYTDTTAEASVTYFYFVTALDRAPEPNESRRSETVSASRRE